MQSKDSKTRNTALLIGATGLVGRHLLDRLIADDRYARIHVLTRRPLARSDDRLEVRIQPFDRLTDLIADEPDFFAVDDFFCCLGTTLAQAGSKPAFTQVDLDYNGQLARAAADNGARRAFLVSAVGADPRSLFFYNRIKGQTEAAFSAMGFEQLHLVRPSLLLGDRSDNRPGEAFGQHLAPWLSPLCVGPLRRFRPIEAEAVADCMVDLARRDKPGVHVEFP